MTLTKLVIEYQKVSKTYKIPKSFKVKAGQVEAISDITFDVSENEFVSLVGPSGCGKSTLLKITAGLIPHNGGSVKVDGKEVTSPTPDVGFAFQNPVLLPWRKVLDNIMLPAEMLDLNIEEYRKKAMDLIKIVGLEGFEHSYPFELSGGMQQRASLCRALVHEPSVLLMDEPFGALDALTREEMNVELLRIWDARKKTVLLVTHDIHEAVFLSDRVIVLSKRPSIIDAVVEVKLSRPRTREIKYTSEFASYVTKVRERVLK